jgi:SynChlorMet cassette radical SAM/SPASM protein ScmE
VKQDVSLSEWLTFFGELKKCGIMKICIQGGEPFLRKDLPQIIQGIVNSNMRFSILSNGTLITDEIADFIARTGRCDHIQISVDGSRSEVHDSHRGEGTFKRAIHGIHLLKKHKISHTVRVTIHHLNVEDLPHTAQFLLEDIKIPSFSTNAASYLGLCRENAPAVMLTTEDRTRAMEILTELSRTYPGRITAQAGPLAEASMWTQMEKARIEGKKVWTRRGSLTGCNGFLDKLAVRADGMIIPCIQLGHIELGRINRDDLISIWQNHPELKRLRERHSIPLTSFQFCKDCPYIPYCTGSCPGIAYTLVHDAYHPSPDACLRDFLKNGGRLPNEQGDTA